jgi:predicted DNA-binding transcriptional regulator YafY
VAVVYSGHRWYLVAYDLDRDDWRTFRIDRIRGRVRAGERGRRRIVPGGDAAAFVRDRLRGTREGDGLSESPPGRIRLEAPAARARSRIPSRYAEVEPDGDEACIVTTRGAWSRGFLVWMATLDEPMEVLDPPELIEVARVVAARLAPNPIG